MLVRGQGYAGGRGCRHAMTASSLIAAVIGVLAPTAAAQVVRNDRPQRPESSGTCEAPIYSTLEPRRAPATAGQDPLQAEDLLRQFTEYHTALRYEAAAEYALMLVDRIPDQPLAYYNLACVMARLHRSDEALDALETAVDRGWRNVVHMKIDSDLRIVQGTDRFQQLIDRMGRLIEADRLVAQPIRTDAWPAVTTELNERIPELMDRYQVPGLTVALVNDGKLVWTSSYGVADRDTGELMRVDHGYRLESPVHLMAMLGALQSEVDGRLSLAEVLLYKDEMAQAARLAGEPEFQVTSARRRHKPPEQPAANVYADGRSAWPTAALGEPLLLGLLVAAIETMQPFEKYCRERIIEPAEMPDTDFVTAATDESLVVGHSLLGSAVEPVRQGIGTQAVRTTAHDLGSLVAALLDAATDRLETGDRPVGQLCARARRTATGLGLSVHFETTAAGPRLQMAENRNGIGCLIRGYEDTGNGVVILFNAETGTEAALRIAQLALGGQP